MIMATSLLLGACNPATDVNVKETGDKNLIGKFGHPDQRRSHDPGSVCGPWDVSAV